MSGPSTSSSSSPYQYGLSIPNRVQLQFSAHDGEVNVVNWSPIKHLIATGGADKIVKMWDVRKSSMSTSGEFIGSNASINSVGFDSTGSYLLSASNDNACRIWTTQDCKLRHTLTGHGKKVTSAKFLGDIVKVVTGSHDRTLKIWDLQRRSCSKTISTISGCNDLVTMSRDTIITGHMDKKIRFWDTRYDTINNEIQLQGKVTSLDISVDNWLLVSCDRADNIQLFDLRNYKMIELFKHDSFRVYYDSARVAFDRDTRLIAAGSNTGLIFIWNLNGNLEKILQTNSQAAITAVAWDPFGSSIAAVDRGKFCSIWGD